MLGKYQHGKENTKSSDTTPFLLLCIIQWCKSWIFYLEKYEKISRSNLWSSISQVLMWMSLHITKLLSIKINMYYQLPFSTLIGKKKFLNLQSRKILTWKITETTPYNVMYVVYRHLYLQYWHSQVLKMCIEVLEIEPKVPFEAVLQS